MLLFNLKYHRIKGKKSSISYGCIIHEKQASTTNSMIHSWFLGQITLQIEHI